MKFFIISLIKPKADAYQLHYPGKKKTKIFTQYHDTMSNSMIYNVKISSYGAKLSSYSDKHHQIMKRAYQNKLSDVMLRQRSIKWGSISMKAYCDQVTVYNDEVRFIMNYEI